jgi:hypothetical protein
MSAEDETRDDTREDEAPRPGRGLPPDRERPPMGGPRREPKSPWKIPDWKVPLEEIAELPGDDDGGQKP